MRKGFVVSSVICGTAAALIWVFSVTTNADRLVIPIGMLCAFVSVICAGFSAVGSPLCIGDVKLGTVYRVMSRFNFGDCIYAVLLNLGTNKAQFYKFYGETRFADTEFVQCYKDERGFTGFYFYNLDDRKAEQKV